MAIRSETSSRKWRRTEERGTRAESGTQGERGTGAESGVPSKALYRASNRQLLKRLADCGRGVKARGWEAAVERVTAVSTLVVVEVAAVCICSSNGSSGSCGLGCRSCKVEHVHDFLNLMEYIELETMGMHMCVVFIFIIILLHAD